MDFYAHIKYGLVLQATAFNKSFPEPDIDKLAKLLKDGNYYILAFDDTLIHNIDEIKEDGNSGNISKRAF